MVEIAPEIRARRSEAIYQVFKGIPNDFIAAMIEGLETADVITPGRLFAGRSGGCVVGVTLRVVEPDFRGRPWLKGWYRKSSMNKLYRGVAQDIPHLRALEQVFDASVQMAWTLYPNEDRQEVAKAVANWFASEARADLLLREMNSDWLNKVVAEREALETAAVS